jgi:hypothetical protein
MPSNEELQQARDILSGGDTTAQTQETPPQDVTEIDRARSLLGGGEQTQEQPSIPGLTTSDIMVQKSPLSIGERLQLSFSDDSGKETFLRSKFALVERLDNGKFAVGNTPGQLTPIDPEGMFNDVLGDVADIIGEIPVIAGQIAGTAIGATSGSVVPGAGTAGGAILGSAAGAGLGEAAKIGVGRALGLREKKAMEEATDIAISTAFGAAGEGLAQGAKFVGTKVIAPKISKMLDKRLAKAKLRAQPTIDPITGAEVRNKPTPMASTMGKIFRFTAGVPEEATQDAAHHGFAKTFSKVNTDERQIIPLVDKVKRAAKLGTEKLGKKVKTALKGVNKQARRMTLKGTDDAVNTLKSNLKSIGMLDDAGNLSSNLSKEQSNAIKRVFELTNSESNLVGPGGKSLGVGLKPMNFDDALKVEDIVEGLINDLGPKGESTLQKTLIGFLADDPATGTRGIRTLVNERAKALNQGVYLDAKKQLGDFKELLSNLKGVKSRNPADVESFLKTTKGHNIYTRDQMQLLQKAVPEIKFLDDLEMFNAAQAFGNANPNMLRLGSIMSALGANALFGGDTLASQAGALGAGLAVGSPAGIKFILKNAAKVGNVSKGAIPKTVVNSNASLIKKLLAGAGTAAVSQAGANQVR